MSLRRKVLLLTSLTLTGLLLVLALLSAVIWFGSAAQLEQRAVQSAADRVMLALSGDLAELDRFVADWSGWDDTYAFIDDHNDAYIASNLAAGTFLRSQIDSIIFIDNAGQVVWGQSLDPATGDLRPLSPQWVVYFPALTQHPNIDSTVISIISLDGHPSLVAARPILTSDYQGPIRGTLIMERRLTDEHFRALAQVVGVTLNMSEPQAVSPADFAQAERFPSKAVGSAQVDVYARPVDEYQTATYLLVQTVHGAPALLLRAEVPRAAYQYALAATRILIISLLVIGVVFGVLTIVLMDRFVLRRLAVLDASVGHITTSGDLSARVPVAAHDELSRLAQSINSMLTALDQAQQENARLLQGTQRQLNELSLLHTAAITTARSTSLDAALQEIAQLTYDTFKAVNTMVVLCEQDGVRFRLRASVGMLSEIPATREFKAGQGIIGAVAAGGETILVEDVSREARYYAADPRTRSELCAPLKAGERVIGLINVESDQAGFFTDSDRQLLETLAHNLGMIVENLRLLEEVRAANAQLLELDRLKSQFVANMSHELRTPLNAILGFSELLGDETPGALNAEQRDYVQHIHTSGRHLLALINDILDLSKLQAQRIDLERRPLPLAEIVAAAQTFVWPAMQRKQQIFSNDVPSDLPSLYIDPLRVKQVLINLLNNASKFTPPAGHITVAADVWHDGWVRVGVRDTGAGIPPDKHAQVFEEFTQFGDTRTVVERGTGLGLAIARRLIELHGGQIWIDSGGLPGEGATFYFTLPVADAAAATRRAATRLLVIDDDPGIVDLLQSMLLPPDYEVYGVTDALLALEHIRRNQPDVILLDLMMPEIDGVQLLTALQRTADTARLPVIVLTAKELSAAERAELDRLAQVVLTKTQLRRTTLLSALQQVRPAVSPGTV
jgi:signal transduction histidine kinase